MKPFTKRRFGAVIALGLAATLAVSGCAPAAPGNGTAKGGPITIGVVFPPNSFDPYLSVWGGQWAVYMNAAYDTLIHQEPDGTFSPALAESWEYKSTTEFELKLREGGLFSDGKTPINAEAVKANLDRLFDVIGPRTSELGSMLESVEAVDEYTVSIKLTTPNPSMERILSQLLGMIVNPNALADPAALNLEPQGAGPYVLDVANTVVGDTYVFTRNEFYWNEDAYPFDTLTAKVYVDQNAMLTALQSGVAQIGYGAPDTIDAAKGSGLEVVTQPVNVFQLVLGDREGTISKPLGDVRVRQALNYAVDRDAILESIYRGEGKTTTQVFTEGTDGFDPELDDRFPYDPKEAKKLLAEAGYPDGFEFTAALGNVGRDGNYLQALASYFAEVGVTMNIEPLPTGTATVDVFKKYAAYSNGYGGQDTYGDAKILVLPPAAINNALGSEDPEFTALWEKGANAESEADRKAAFQELSKVVVEKSWFVATTAVNAVAYFDPKRVTNVKFTPHISVPLIYGWQKVQ